MKLCDKFHLDCSNNCSETYDMTNLRESMSVSTTSEKISHAGNQNSGKILLIHHHSMWKVCHDMLNVKSMSWYDVMMTFVVFSSEHFCMQYPTLTVSIFILRPGMSGDEPDNHQQHDQLRRHGRFWISRRSQKPGRGGPSQIPGKEDPSQNLGKENPHPSFFASDSVTYSELTQSALGLARRVKFGEKQIEAGGGDCECAMGGWVNSQFTWIVLVVQSEELNFSYSDLHIYL